MFTDSEKGFLLGLIDFSIKSLEFEKRRFPFYRNIVEEFDSTISSIKVVREKIYNS